MTEKNKVINYLVILAMSVVIVCAFVGLGLGWLFSESKITEYELDSWSETEYKTSDSSTDTHNYPAIHVNISYGIDREIHLPKNITFVQALQMCDSLNATLKKRSSN